MKLIAIIALAVTLMGCAQDAVPRGDASGEKASEAVAPSAAGNANDLVRPARNASSSVNDTEACGAGAVATFVGEPATDAIKTQIRERSGAETVRFLKPDDIVTMEFRGERLTVSVDEKNVIRRIACG